MKFFLNALEKGLKDLMGEGYKSQARIIGEKMAEELMEKCKELKDVKKEDFQKILEKIMEVFKEEGLIQEYEKIDENSTRVRCIIHEHFTEKIGNHTLCYISRGFMDAILRKSGLNLELKVKPDKIGCIYSLGKIEILI